MKKIILAMVLAIICSIGAKAITPTLTFTLNTTKGPFYPSTWAYAKLIVICPNEINPKYYYYQVPGWPTIVTTWTSGTYTITSGWVECDAWGNPTGGSSTPNCTNLVLIAVWDACPTSFATGSYTYIPANSPTPTSCGYTVDINSSYSPSGPVSNTINVY